MKKIFLPALALTVFVACQNAKENNTASTQTAETALVNELNSASVIELTEFQLVKGTTDTQLADAVKKMNDSFLVNQAGFVMRNLSKKNDSTWADVIFWKDTTAINNAMIASQTSTAVAPFFQLIQMDKVKMDRVHPVYRFSKK